MTHNEMFGKAEWVVSGDRCPAPFFRQIFRASKGEKAEITICGLGFFELYINGKRVSDDLFVPANSDFHRYDEQTCLVKFGEETAHRIYCLQYNISAFLEDGDNCIAVMVAPGWYFRYGKSKLCFRIELDGSEVLSGAETRTLPGYITAYDLTKGETHDYRLFPLDDEWMSTRFDDSKLATALTVPAPESEYYIQDCPADKIIRHLTPRLIGESETTRLYDVGENITGWPIVCCESNRVETVVVRAGEELTSDGRLNDGMCHGQQATFITRGVPRTLHMKFTWHGFRYFEVTKNAVAVDCAVIHSEVADTSSFECSNETLNWLYSAYIRTQLTNMHAGIPSDCPHIERRGYTGDGQLCCEAAMLLLDAKRFYRKWLGDISDCQDRKSGHVQYTAPYICSGGGPGGWGCAIIEVPYVFFKQYGDLEPAKEYFPQMLRYFDYLEAHSENDLIISDQPGEWCLGEWCTPTLNGTKRPVVAEPFINNYFYIKSINRVIELARLIGKEEVIPSLEAVALRKKDAIMREYWDAQTGNFEHGIEGANAFAIDLGLGDSRTLDNLVKHYCNKTVFDTGIFGTDIVPRVLFERGFGELASRLLAAEDFPSFGNWRKNGATTLWEEWQTPRSMSHPMFGAPVRYLFNFILGIRQTGVAYKDLVISPFLPSFLTYAKGQIATESGTVSVNIGRIDGATTIDIGLCEGICASLEFDGKSYPLKAGQNSFLL